MWRNVLPEQATNGVCFGMALPGNIMVYYEQQNPTGCNLPTELICVLV